MFPMKWEKQEKYNNNNEKMCKISNQQKLLRLFLFRANKKTAKRKEKLADNLEMDAVERILVLHFWYARQNQFYDDKVV